MAWHLYVTRQLIVLIFVVWEASANHGTITRIISDGQIRGNLSRVDGKMYQQFLGIPYAEPPVGTLRFRPSQPLASKWSGILDAYNYGPWCPQVAAPTVALSEDCLTLNVFVPGENTTTGDNLSVMVFIHGGGYIIGGSEYYRGRYLVTEGNVLLVTINYRLGAFGFLSTGDDNARGNFGLWDQHMAFKWIQANIDKFGGDPHSVTIFGESAGSSSVSLQAVAIRNRGLFQRVISESGTIFSAWALNTNEKAIRFTKSLAHEIGCDDSEELTSNGKLVECLRGKSVKEFVDHLTKMMDILLFATPVDDGDFFRESVKDIVHGKMSHELWKFTSSVDYIAGCNNAEGSAAFTMYNSTELSKGVTSENEALAYKKIFGPLLPKDANHELIGAALKRKYRKSLNSPITNLERSQMLVQATGDSMFLAPTVAFAYWKSRLNGTGATYMYYFTHEHNVPLIFAGERPSWFKGLGHAEELQFVFGKNPIMSYGNYTAAEDRLMADIQKMWSNFARSGNPNINPTSLARPHWPEYTSDEQKYIELNLNMTIQQKLLTDRVTFWTDVIPKLVTATSPCPSSSTILEKGPPTISTSYGKLVGNRFETTANGMTYSWDEYLGVPYATPPVGKLRFKQPIPPPFWGIRNATTWAPYCPSAGLSTGFNLPTKEMKEDCLYMNIHVPRVPQFPHEKLAVMFFIHGGSYLTGGASDMDGKALSWAGRVIVVTTNYRLGALGFLSTADHHTRGNNGLWDQNVALAWIKQNIASFGGDPERITIFGESAGAGSVMAHVFSQYSRPLFNNAIVESQHFGPWISTQDHKKITAGIADKMNCSTSSSDAMISCLQKAPVSELVKNGVGIEWSPIADGIFLPKSIPELMVDSSNYANKSMLIGFNQNEGAYFVYATLKHFNISLSKGLTKEQFVKFMDLMIGSAFPANRATATAVLVNQYTDWNKPDDPQALAKGLVDAFGDFLFVAGSVLAAGVHSTKQPTYVYHYKHRSPTGGLLINNITAPGVRRPDWWKADHADELISVFGLGFTHPELKWTEKDQIMSFLMMAYWSNFARFGEPTGGGLVPWPEYKAPKHLYMEFDDYAMVKSPSGPIPERINFWLTVMIRLESKSSKRVDKTPTKSEFRGINERILKDETPITRTAFGPVQGITVNVADAKQAIGSTDKLDIYFGIPYAKAPVGPLRWRATQDPDNWAVVRNASSIPPLCPQRLTTTWLKASGLTQISEDCLYLNVYSPRGSKKKAVLVYVHGHLDGRAFKNGGGILFDAAPMSVIGDIVVVTFNYRLGVLGFGSTGDSVAKGNYGMYDIGHVLKWVKNNIGFFGGDPEKVTLAGHGSGSHAVSALALSPHVEGMFKRVLSMSEEPFNPLIYTKQRLVEHSALVASRVGCTGSTQEIIDCARPKPVDDILTADNNAADAYDFQYYPVDDGSINMTELTRISGTLGKVDYLTGIMVDEAAYFMRKLIPNGKLNSSEFLVAINMTIKANIPHLNTSDYLYNLFFNVLQYEYAPLKNVTDPSHNVQLFDRLLNDMFFFAPLSSRAWGHANLGGKTFVYINAHKPEIFSQGDNYGATYLDDMAFIAGVGWNFYNENYTKILTEGEKALSFSLLSYWTNFVNSGWPEYETLAPNYVEISSTVTVQSLATVEHGVALKRIAFWTIFVPEFVTNLLRNNTCAVMTTTPGAVMTTTPGGVMTTGAAKTPPVTEPSVNTATGIAVEENCINLSEKQTLKNLGIDSNNVQSVFIGLVVVTAVLALFFVLTTFYCYRQGKKLSKLKKEFVTKNGSATVDNLAYEHPSN